MSTKKTRPTVTKARVYPNRIAELTKRNRMTYASIADAVDPPVHEITIARLATGRIELTPTWMERLARVFGVAPIEILSSPPAINLRRVRVVQSFASHIWATTHIWDNAKQYDVMIPDDDTLRDSDLYAGEIADGSMNGRYPAGAVVVVSRLTQRPNEIVEDKRYHVRVTRQDGMREETIRTLVRHSDGRYFLRPESDNPEFQEWMPLDGRAGETIELLGRVRYIVHRED